MEIIKVSCTGFASRSMDKLNRCPIQEPSESADERPRARRLTCKMFYKYRFQVREDTRHMLSCGRLFQQYVVDMYVKIEAQRLEWIRRNQDEIRSALYQGLQDHVQQGDNARPVGRRTVLPSSVTCSPRYMHQKYQDAMAIVRKFGKPDFFVTFTCNPNWKEIQDNLLFKDQKPSDRPDLICRVFQLKLKLLREKILKKHFFGRVAAMIDVIEFQKRGLPHCHMLIILHPDHKLKTPDEYDEFVSAEIPPETRPLARETVLNNLVHGPCGDANPSCPCMKNGRCSKGYPKSFAPETLQSEQGYPIYRRREGDEFECKKKHLRRWWTVDSTWVVPHNLKLCAEFDAHINVEVCSTIKAVKYLYKYVYKGHDMAQARVRAGSASQESEPREINEIDLYLDSRYVGPCETLWRTYGFRMCTQSVNVVRLDLHEEGRNRVRFRQGHEEQVNPETKLTAFFKLNEVDEHARTLTYMQIPEHYTWKQKSRSWKRRKNPTSTVGRLYSASPSQGERFFLRLLLLQRSGPCSFKDLKVVDGVEHPTFQSAAIALGLFEDDEEWERCLDEASSHATPHQLRQLFVTILAFCSPKDPLQLFTKFQSQLCDDYAYQLRDQSPHDGLLRDLALRDIEVSLSAMNKSLETFQLPSIDTNFDYFELTASDQQGPSADSLNEDQRSAFDRILDAILKRLGGSFFIDGPGGTGKTYLYNAILRAAAEKGLKGVSVASSGIAALLLKEGRTAHSMFKIPLGLDTDSVCSIDLESKHADRLREIDFVVWDEAPMTHRHAFEAVNRLFQDIHGNKKPFGGITFIFGGDFRQILPVVVKGSRAQTVGASLKASKLWDSVCQCKLTVNMRILSSEDPKESWLANWQLRVGDGLEASDEEDRIVIPKGMFKSLDEFSKDVESTDGSTDFVSNVILCSTNKVVRSINQRMLRRLDGAEVVYKSVDSVTDDVASTYPTEYLNTIETTGLPLNQLRLKLGAPIMILRNLNVGSGLCNGTRLIVKKLTSRCIVGEIVSGPHKGSVHLIPKIDLSPPDTDTSIPVPITRRQFPVTLAFAMTINKSQGQTLEHAKIYLPEPLFAHGQLYVAISRVRSYKNITIYAPTDRVKNIVYTEVLSS